MSIDPKYNSLGQGWDSFTQEMKNQIVDFEYIVLTTGAECSIHVCESTQEIVEKLELDVSVDVDTPSASFNGKFDFLKELSSSSNAVTILLKAKRTYSAKVNTAKLMETVHKDTTLTNLVKYAGDSYVSYVQSGVEYYACYQFKAQNAEQKTKLSLSAQASFGALSKVTGSLTASLNQVARETNTSYSFHQSLIGVPVALPSSDEMTDFALKLSSQDAVNPAVLRLQTEPYSALLSPPVGFEKVHAYVQAYKQPKWYMFSLMKIEMHTKVILEQISQLRALYKFYNSGGKAATLDRNAKLCNEALTAISKWKSEHGDFEKPVEQPIVDVACLAIPYAEFHVDQGDFWGREQGGSMSFDVDTTSVYACAYPKTCKGRGANTLDRFTTVYAFRNPKDPENANDELMVEKSHGGEGGAPLSFSQSFEPNSIINVGMWANYAKGYKRAICGVEFYKKGVQKNFQLGSNWGEFHADTFPEQSCFLGFAVRSGQFIDAMKTLWVTFEEPTWKPLAPNSGLTFGY